MIQLEISLSSGLTPVSGLLLQPVGARFLLVLGHGAGAGMRHPFMEQLAQALAAENVATLRYQFPYMEAGSKRPDRPEVARLAILGALDQARQLETGLPLFAGGKSFGGRMTSLLAARQPLPDVRGVVFFGFPLHPAGKPGADRAAHLPDIPLPLLFLQGTRDRLAEEGLIAEVCRNLPRAELHFLEDADHSFHLPKRAPMTDELAVRQLAVWTRGWMDEQQI